MAPGKAGAERKCRRVVTAASASELEISLRAADPFPASRHIESLPRWTSAPRAPVSGQVPWTASLPTTRSPGDFAISRGTNRWMGMLTAGSDGIIPRATKAGGDEEFLRSLWLLCKSDPWAIFHQVKNDS